MVRIRSRLVRRGRTGRKANTLRVARRRVQVHRHFHRRYAGIKGGPRPGGHRKRLVTHRPGTKRHHRPGLHRRYKGRHQRHKRHYLHKRHMRHGIHRHFKGRRKSLHKRHVRHGLHRKFHGRHLTHKRHVKPGLHRHFHGRKTTHHKGHFRPQKPKAAPISAASYLSMF